MINASALFGLQRRFRFSTFKKTVLLSIVSEANFWDAGLDRTITAFVSTFSAMDSVALAVIVEPAYTGFLSPSVQTPVPSAKRTTDTLVVDVLEDSATSTDASLSIPVAYFESSSPQCAAVYGCAPIVDAEQCVRAVTSQAWRSSFQTSSSPSATALSSAWDTLSRTPKPGPSCGNGVNCVTNSSYFPIGCSVKLPNTDAEKTFLRAANYRKHTITVNSNTPWRPSGRNASSQFDLSSVVQAAATVVESARGRGRTVPKPRAKVISAAVQCGTDESGSAHVCMCQCTTPAHSAGLYNPKAKFKFAPTVDIPSRSDQPQNVDGKRTTLEEYTRLQLTKRIESLVVEAQRKSLNNARSTTLPQVLIKVSNCDVSCFFPRL